MFWIKEACLSGARLAPCCSEAYISVRTYRRWVTGKNEIRSDKRSESLRPTPPNKLSEAEVAEILTVCSRPEFASLPPSQIVPILADESIYLASESTFYRILKAHQQLTHRGRSKKPQRVKMPTTHLTTAPKQLWSWDITYLPSRVKAFFFYLYLFEDLFSRKIVGYEVYEEEGGDHAAALLQRTIVQEQCVKNPISIVLHSDNGAPMKSQTFKAKMEEMGVVSSYSRPRVSNDNPYSEALFRTLKYRPLWPSHGFLSLDEARVWVTQFVDWYNNQHRHSQIGFVTPNQKHEGKDELLLQKRKGLYEQARLMNPLRWSGTIRNFDPVKVVTLNPEKKENTHLGETT